MITAIPSGIRWASAGTILAQASSLLRLVVVSASVGIQDLGYYAIGAALAASVGLLGDSGLRQLYLSRQADAVEADADSLLSAVWFGGVGIQLLVTVGTVPLGAAYVAFMGSKNLVVMAMAVAISGCALISTLQNPKALARERQGDFAPSIKAESIGQIAGLLAVCATVGTWPSVWLLVLGQGTASLVSSLSSYVLLGIPRQLRFRIHSLSMLLKLGRPFVWISVTTYVTASLDKLLIGLMLSPTATGIFFLAQRFAEAPRQLHASILGRTALPHYAAAITNNGILGLRLAIKHYLAITGSIFIVALIALVVAHGLYGAGLLGSKWEAISPILAILIFGTACRAGCHVLAPALVVFGAVQVETRLKVVEGIVYLAILPVAILAGGLVGTATAFSGIYALSLYRRYIAVSSVTKKVLQDGKL